MSLRMTVIAVCAAMCFVAVPAHAAQEIELGTKVTGEMDGERKPVLGSSVSLYQHEFKIRLKAGQSVNLNGTVVGKDRRLNIILMDPKGRPLGGEAPPAIKALNLNFEEVPSTGIYTILVVSDFVGPFTLSTKEMHHAAPDRRAEKGDEPRRKTEDEDVEDLEKEIEALRKQLEALTKKLDAAKSKAKPKK